MNTVRHKGLFHVYVILLFQSLIGGATHIVAKVVVADVDPFALTLIRSLISSLAMLLILLVRRRPLAITRESHLLVAGLSLLTIPVNQFLFLYGMQFTAPSNAALLYATTPIFVLVFSYVLLRERLTGRKVLGVVVGVSGVMIVIFERGVSTSEMSFVGNLIVVVAVTAWGLYTVYAKRLIGKIGPIEATALTMLCGTIMFIPIGIVPALNFPFGGLSMSSWLQILYLGIITSVLSYILWYYALARIEAGKVALFTNLQPVFATVLAVLVLDQDITAQFVLGGCVAVCGVAIAQFG
jgi:drug/metabolite transporter (DMT)-like permease